MDHGWASEILDEYVNIADLALLTISFPESDSHKEDLIKLESLKGIAYKIMNYYLPDSVMNELLESRKDERIRLSRIHAQSAKFHAQNQDKIEALESADSPSFEARSMHPWIWGSAEQLWRASAFQEAVMSASRVVNARIQQKSGRREISDSDLVMQVFDVKPPEEGKPRLWLPGDRSTQGWRSEQEGAKFFGVGCFRAIRNPAAHMEFTNWSQVMAFEYLIAFSIFSRWVEISELQPPV